MLPNCTFGLLVAKSTTPPLLVNELAVTTLPPVILPPVNVMSPPVPEVLILPAVIVPETDKFDSVPTLVILGCAFDVTVAAVLALPEYVA